MKKVFVIVLAALALAGSCGHKGAGQNEENAEVVAVTVPEEEEEKYVPIKIIIEKELLYDKYTLADTFPYKDTVRFFQWDKIREQLRIVDSIQLERAAWGVLQNKSNTNGEAPLVKEWHRNEYTRVSDKNNVERYQSIPLYTLEDGEVPELYGRDGSPVRIIHSDSTDRVIVETINFGGRWSVPKKYVKNLADTVTFHRVAMVDRAMQTIMTLEKSGDKWLVRSMNPATTGAHNPPYAQPTPLGIFVVQEKKAKMLYTHDGSSEIAGYAPWASRFCNGGYIHGVPLNSVNAATIEWSATLGTIPRSHMCVRNVTSHAKFVYDWAKALNSLVVVIE